MQPSISIVIPVYNGASELDIPIKSLQNQTQTDFEVIIIDDGSIDGTAERIETFSANDNRIKYFYQSNQGVAIARNNGIREAKGKYICFLDADDFYEDTFLEKMFNKIDSHALDYVYCGFNYVTPNNKISNKTKFLTKHLFLDYIKGNISISTTAWMINKKYIDERNIQFPSGIAWGEDFEFFCEMLANDGKYGYVDEYLVNYRIEFEENRLSRFSLDMLDEEFKTINRLSTNSKISYSNQITLAFTHYRLPARLTYGLLKAISQKKNKNDIVRYYDKYKTSIDNFRFNNGLRSIKLLLKKLQLKIYIIRH